MATRRFDCNREQSVADISAGNAGNGGDDHCPTGKSSYNANLICATLHRFAHDWSGMTKVTKVVLNVKMTSEVHTEHGSAASARVQRADRSWSSGGGGENNWSTSASGARWLAGGYGEGYVASKDMPQSAGTWVAIDITDGYMGLVPTWLGGVGGSNNGIYVYADNESLASHAFEYWGFRSSYPPYLTVTYETNTKPNKPVITSPANGAVFAPGTTTIPLSFTGSDPDAGDTMSKFGYTWAHGPTSGENSGTGYKSGFNVTGFPLSTAGAAPGSPDQLTVKTYDQDGAVSSVSDPITVTISVGPTVGSPTPGSSAFADVHNLAEAAIWTAAGNHAKPIVKFTYQHAAARNMQAYRVRLYSDGSTVLWDSGTVALVATPGQVITVNTPLAIKGDGTQYRWGVEVQDIDGTWSPTMTPTPFKVRWGQAIYSENVTILGKDFKWANATPAQGRSQFLHRLADSAAGAGATAWSTAPPTQPATGAKAYYQVLVRLLATVVGQNPALPSMTLTYSKGDKLVPDKWLNVQPTSASMELVASTRRFGARSLKMRSLVTTSHVIFPYRKDSSPLDGIEVMPGVDYTFSAYIKTLSPLTGEPGPLGGGAVVKIGIRNQAGSAYLTPLTPCDPDYGAIQTNDSSHWPDSWQRLAGWFTCPADTTLVTPDVWCNGIQVGNEYFIDSLKLEEGRVASLWTPGFLGDAMTIDRAGIQIDVQAGGVFRLRGATGTARGVVEMGDAGFKYGTDTELSSPSTGVMAVNGVPIGQGPLVGGRCETLGPTVNITANATQEMDFAAPTALEDPYGFRQASGRLKVPVGKGGLYLIQCQVDGDAPAGTAATASHFTLVALGTTGFSEAVGTFARFDTASNQGLAVSVIRQLADGHEVWITMRPAGGSASVSRVRNWSITRLGSGYA